MRISVLNILNSLEKKLQKYLVQLKQRHIFALFY